MKPYDVKRGLVKSQGADGLADLMDEFCRVVGWASWSAALLRCVGGILIRAFRRHALRLLWR